MLVTVGTVCGVSAVGTTETHRALAVGSDRHVGHAAFDAGRVDFDPAGTALEPRFVRRWGDGAGVPMTLEDVEREWGDQLRAGAGIRPLAQNRRADHVPCDLAAPLAHDLEEGGLRGLAGLSQRDLRSSSLSDMFGLFDDDPRLGPSLQGQLFLYAGLGALAALPQPLCRLLPQPHRFRVAASCAFPGLDSHQALASGMQPGDTSSGDGKVDRLAFRLAASLGTHGPALLAAMLSPPVSLTRVRRDPDLLQVLQQAGTPLRRVPQAPMVTSAACASALVSLADAGIQMVARYPGHEPAQLMLWTGADAGLGPDARVLEGFGAGAMMTREKLDAINAARPDEEPRAINDCLMPFDVDAQGTIVGNAGSGLVITTLDFALRQGLDVTSIVVGWGQSGETGGKGHFAGVGFGGENALLEALEMAYLAHGYTVADFQHVVAHATGTRTNSKTELSSLHAARLAAAEYQGLDRPLPVVTIGAPKAIGDGHTMGETGLRATGEALYYVLGERTVGVPSLRHVDPDLGEPAEWVSLSAEPVAGNVDGGALVPTQGFGGYDGAVALRSANAEAFARYEIEDGLLESYVERWPEIRAERVEREARWRRTRGMALQLAEQHRWHTK
ncbi:MAG: hypothetical protein R3190_05830 [Thermoanaerobaculia bacterium]|nr:hypothetical protein [Thermoanaerobaculia bacterium]